MHDTLAPAAHTQTSIRQVMAFLTATLAFSGVIAALPLVLGTSDLENYEHGFFSLDRGTKLQAVRVFGHPVYTLGIGLGVRLPLLPNLGASPAAFVAPYLPAPLTYWLLITCAIALAAFIVRHALEPLCGRLISWLALMLLFCSAPVVNYTLIDDWLHVAVTYAAFVGCVFAPHAMLASCGTGRESTVRYLRGLWLAAAVGALISGSHSGYLPLLAGVLILTSMLALCRSEYPIRDRIVAVAVLAAVSVIVVALQIPDMLREVNVAGPALAEMSRGVDGPKGILVSPNIFPFGAVEARLPFTNLLLALVSLAVGLASPGVQSRTLMIGSAVLAILLSIAAAHLSLQSMFAPSNVWALRDPATAFAIFSGSLAAVRAITWHADHRLSRARLAVAALTLAALQGPAYAMDLVRQSSPEFTPNNRAWNRDLTPPETRVVMRGLAPDQVLPGERLALWPGEASQMRRAKYAPVDFADAGYLLVTAWTEQRTMRNLVAPNDRLFRQSIELAPPVLCDARTVQFLRLRYLLAPPDVQCEPWRLLPGLQVDNRLEVHVATAWDTRVRALPIARLSEPLARASALSVGAALIPALMPVPSTSVGLGSDSISIQLDDPSASINQALVLPVAYDSAWRSTNGQTLEVAGLLGLIGVDRRHVALQFVPDTVAVLRAAATTLGQLLALAGLLGMAFIRPVAGANDAVVAFEQRAVTGTRLALRQLQPHTRLYLVYSAAVVLALRWQPRDADETGLVTALLVPIAALVVGRLSQWRFWHRGIGVALLALVFVRTAAVGSLSPIALYDPPFWALLTTIATGLFAATRRRWRAGAASAAALAGACAMTATMLPLVTGGESGVRTRYVDIVYGSLTSLSNQIGVVALLALAAVWVHAIGFGGGQGANGGSMNALARGALLAALIFTLAGVVPTTDGLDNAWALALGALLGLAETTPARRVRDGQVMMRAAGTS